MKLSKKTNTISIKNEFCQAEKINPLSINASKIYAWVISQIKPTDDIFKKYRITPEDLQLMLGMDRANASREVEKITEELSSSKIVRYIGEDIEKIPLVTRTIERRGQSWISIEINPLLQSYFLDLKRDGLFTRTELTQILTFKNKYSFPFYLFLRSKLHKKCKEYDFYFEVKELRKILGLEKKYPNYSQLNQRVIQSIQKELEEKSDISFTYEKSRKSSEIYFELMPNEEYIAKQEETAEERAKAEMKKQEQSIFNLEPETSDIEKFQKDLRFHFNFSLLAEHLVNIQSVCDSDYFRQGFILELIRQAKEKKNPQKFITSIFNNKTKINNCKLNGCINLDKNNKLKLQREQEELDFNNQIDKENRDIWKSYSNTHKNKLIADYGKTSTTIDNVSNDELSNILNEELTSKFK